MHAEYSRNCNSDGRKVLQLRRSMGQPPYSQFSTGSISTLRDTPDEAGIDITGALRDLWSRTYVAPATTVAVVGPQDPLSLEDWVRGAFAGMRAARGDGGGDAAADEAEGSSGRYGQDK